MVACSSPKIDTVVVINYISSELGFGSEKGGMGKGGLKLFLLLLSSLFFSLSISLRNYWAWEIEWRH